MDRREINFDFRVSSLKSILDLVKVIVIKISKIRITVFAIVSLVFKLAGWSKKYLIAYLNSYFSYQQYISLKSHILLVSQNSVNNLYLKNLLHDDNIFGFY